MSWDVTLAIICYLKALIAYSYSTVFSSHLKSAIRFYCERNGDVMHWVHYVKMVAIFKDDIASS